MGIKEDGVLHEFDRRFQLSCRVFFAFELYVGHLLVIFSSTSGVFDLLLAFPELCVESFLLVSLLLRVGQVDVRGLLFKSLLHLLDCQEKIPQMLACPKIEKNLTDGQRIFHLDSLPNLWNIAE